MFRLIHGLQTDGDCFVLVVQIIDLLDADNVWIALIMLNQ